MLNVERPVFPGEKSLRAMDALIEPLPETPSDPFLVLDQFQEIGAPAVVTIAPIAGEARVTTNGHE